MSAWHEATRLENILAAAKRAARGKRDHPVVARFLMDAEPECLRLQCELRRQVEAPGAWRPGPTRTFRLRDPKPRTITVSPFRDRVVHHVLCAEVESAFERYSIRHSYACWKERGQLRALRQCQRFARGRSWVLRADVASFFASIPHAGLLTELRRRVKDREVLARLEVVLAGPSPGVVPEAGRGLPIGALTSQHLANLYLGVVDHWITDGLGFGRYLRYMDDLAVFGEREELRELLARLRAFLPERLGLRLNERRSYVQPVRDGVPFLGFRIYRNLIRVCPERWRRFRRGHRDLEEAFRRGEVDEDFLARSLASQYAHLEAFDTLRARRRHLRRLGFADGSECGGRGRQRLQPGHPRRLLEEQPAQRARREPQQGRSLQPQRQPGLSPGELDTRRRGRVSARAAGPEDHGSRTAALRPGIDPSPVPCSGAPARSVSGAENTPPGGGASGVAVGPSLRRGR